MKIANTDSWPKNIFTSPHLTSASDFYILEIDISSAETQVFLLDHQAIYLPSMIWADPQRALIERALSSINVESIRTISNRRVLCGVWHFGHLLGDHSYHFFSSPARAIKQKPLHISSSPCQQVWMSNWFPGVQLDRQFESTSAIRVYRLDNCDIFMPASYPSSALSALAEYCKLVHPSPFRRYPSKLFLTSGRADRLANIAEIKQLVEAKSWAVLSPYSIGLANLFGYIRHAERIVSENGSILFNIFASARSCYTVLASPRCISPQSQQDWDGGGKYNHFHSGLISYHYCRVQAIGKHPFSDTLYLSPDIFY